MKAKWPKRIAFSKRAIFNLLLCCRSRNLLNSKIILFIWSNMLMDVWVKGWVICMQQAGSWPWERSCPIDSLEVDLRSQLLFSSIPNIPTLSGAVFSLRKRTMFYVLLEPAHCAPYPMYQLTLLSAWLSSLSIAALLTELAEVLAAQWKATRAGLSYNQPSYSNQPSYLLGLARVRLLYVCASEMHRNWPVVVNYWSCPLFPPWERFLGNGWLLNCLSVLLWPHFL